MSDSRSSAPAAAATTGNDARAATAVEQVAADKGKGKAVEHVETEDESSDEEMGAGDATVDLDVEEDDFAEIDTSNIIQGGRRTRGTKIDFAAAQANEMIDDDEDDDDEDFQAPKEDNDDDAMAMDTK